MGTFVRSLYHGMKLLFLFVITALFCATFAAPLQEKKKNDVRSQKLEDSAETPQKIWKKIILRGNEEIRKKLHVRRIQLRGHLERNKETKMKINEEAKKNERKNKQRNKNENKRRSKKKKGKTNKETKMKIN